MANKIILVLSDSKSKNPEDVKADTLHRAVMGLTENSSLRGLERKKGKSLQASTVPL